MPLGTVGSKIISSQVAALKTAAVVGSIVMLEVGLVTTIHLAQDGPAPASAVEPLVDTGTQIPGDVSDGTGTDAPGDSTDGGVESTQTQTDTGTDGTEAASSLEPDTPSTDENSGGNMDESFMSSGLPDNIRVPDESGPRSSM
ncbi:MAG: hypothetical protein JW860_00920 [Sedimentisphaerales bacterium]|nr:hypothetical protein [Sedimentisphaerales bacterium]